MSTPKTRNRPHGLIVASNIEAAISGCLGAFESGDMVTLKYRDGTAETANCPAEAAAIRAAVRYQEGNGPPVDLKFFSLVSAVQSQRKAP